MSSPGSSVLNLDLTEGIILRDVDAEDSPDVGETDEQIEGVFAESSEDGEERKKLLRDQLRNTLKTKHTQHIASQDHGIGRSKDPPSDINTLPDTQVPRDRFPQRQFLIFTDAGKPVFVSRPPEATEDITSITGITSALISVFADNTLSPSSSASNADKLRCINAGSTRITFFLRAPLYYVSVSKWGEPESVSRMQLEYLQLQIFSVLTASQLRRIFERRSNFDLGRLLEGTESFLYTLISRLQCSIALYTTLSALSSLRIDPLLRSRIGDTLVPNSKDILYAILVSGDRIVTIVRPKKHSVHPTDLHILLNALHTPSIAANPASWLPICLPKFNPRSFVHAYVCFLDHDQPDTLIKNPNQGKRSFEELPTISVSSEESSVNLATATPSLSDPEVSSAEGSRDHTTGSDSLKIPNNFRKGSVFSDSFSDKGGLALVTVSGGGEFDAVRNWSDNVAKVKNPYHSSYRLVKLIGPHVQTLETTKLLAQLRTAAKEAPYGCSELGIPGLLHFLYKSRVHVQATCPVWDDDYQSSDDQHRLITLYQTVHDAIHAKSGQGGPLKLQYIRTEKEAVMGWITQPFELYIALSPRLPKTAAVGAANAVARWAKREEARLFLRDAPVF
ncbi:DUF254-domain-containing protein [Hysterangium stoloniferum]|nr:DUF254-domain-containing protein [Hysterangium stoloniferum]